MQHNKELTSEVKKAYENIQDLRVKFEEHGWSRQQTRYDSKFIANFNHLLMGMCNQIYGLTQAQLAKIEGVCLTCVGPDCEGCHYLPISQGTGIEEVCPECGGSKQVPAEKAMHKGVITILTYKDCPKCQDKGIYSESGRGSDGFEKCPECHGEGKHAYAGTSVDTYIDTCITCQGTGRQEFQSMYKKGETRIIKGDYIHN